MSYASYRRRHEAAGIGRRGGKMNKVSFSAQKQDESPRIVLTADETIMDKLNIDYVHLGEGELSVPAMFKAILAGEKLPRIIKGGVPSIDEIPNIRAATIHGLVEISRGCGRGCAFCTPNI